MSLNTIIINGNLTADPELNITPQGKKVAKFTVAVNERFVTEKGEKKENTTFVGVECWDKVAENVANCLKRGSPVLVAGNLRQDNWIDRNGKKHSRLFVQSRTVGFYLTGRENAHNATIKQEDALDGVEIPF